MRTLFFQTEATPQYFGYDGQYNHIMLKTERDGINVYARSQLGAGWQRDDAKASMIARTLVADLVGSANSGPVVAVEGGAGPYEVAEEEDALDAFSHYYFTVALTVRGSSR